MLMKNGWVNDYEEGERLEMVGGGVERRSVWREQVVVRVSQP